MGKHGGHVAEEGQISPEEIRKIVSKANTQTFSEAPKYIANNLGGVESINLAGRFHNERHRLGPDFTEADRQWRIKFLSDQNLHPSEPFEVPNYKNSRLNPIRRFYRFPLDIVERAMRPKLGREASSIVRKLIGRSIMGYGIILIAWYNLNYNHATWERARGVRIHHSRTPIYPGDSLYPMPNPRTESWQHFDLKFHDRKALNL